LSRDHNLVQRSLHYHHFIQSFLQVFILLSLLQNYHGRLMSLSKFPSVKDMTGVVMLSNLFYYLKSCAPSDLPEDFQPTCHENIMKKIRMERKLLSFVQMRKSMSPWFMQEPIVRLPIPMNASSVPLLLQTSTIQ
jgi:hypothetical protein